MAYWSSTSWYDEIIKLSIAALEDESKAVADAFAAVLGEVAASSHSQAAQNAVRALEKKASKKAALEALLKDSFTVCLVFPFTDAAAQGRRRACTALTQSWVAYLSHQQVHIQQPSGFALRFTHVIGR